MPIGWLRDRKLIVATTAGGLGSVTAYLRVAEDGTLKTTPFTDDNCVHATAAHLDTLGSQVLTVHPSRCSQGSDPSPKDPAFVRVWPVDDPGAAKTLDVGKVPLLDAVFRPGTSEVVTTTQGASGALVAQLWSGGSARKLIEVPAGPGVLGTQFVPVIFRIEGDRLLFVTPTGPTAKSKLVDMRTGDSIDVGLQGDIPSAAVVLPGI